MTSSSNDAAAASTAAAATAAGATATAALRLCRLVPPREHRAAADSVASWVMRHLQRPSRTTALRASLLLLRMFAAVQAELSTTTGEARREGEGDGGAAATEDEPISCRCMRPETAEQIRFVVTDVVRAAAAAGITSSSSTTASTAAADTSMETLARALSGMFSSENADTVAAVRSLYRQTGIDGLDGGTDDAQRRQRAATPWMAVTAKQLPAQIRSACTAYQDFCVLWDHFVLRQRQQDSGRVFKWNVNKMEPPVPGVVPPDDNEEDEEEEQAMPAEQPQQDPAQRVMALTWKLACFWYHHHYRQKNKKGPVADDEEEERRQRLLSSAAALAFVAVALQWMASPESEEEEAPPAKKARTAEEGGEEEAKDATTTKEGSSSSSKKSGREEQERMIETVVSGAQKGAAYTRWAAAADAQHVKICTDMTGEELQEAVTALVATLCNASKTDESRGSKDDGTHKRKLEGNDDKSSPFLKAIRQVCQEEEVELVRHLPSLIDRLYTNLMAPVGGTKKIPVAAVHYVDEAALAAYDSMDAFCRLTGPPRSSSSSSNDRNSLAPLTPEQFVAENAAKVEQSVANRSPATRTVTPPIITEGMELNEWAVSLLFLELVKPSAKLVRFLKAAGRGQRVRVGQNKLDWQDVMLPVLNKALLRLAQETMADKQVRKAHVTVSTDGSQPGHVQVLGDLTPDKQLSKAVIGLYYHALEAVLYCETERLSTSSHPNIVLNAEFHRAWLACCCSCVTRAVGVTQKLRPSPSLQTLQIYSILHITESNPYAFLKVSETFVRSLTRDTARGNLGSPLIFALPRVLQKDLRQVEINIMDSLLWARKGTDPSPLIEVIDDFKEKMQKRKEVISLWPPKVLAPTLPAEKEDGSGIKIIYPDPDHEDYKDYQSLCYIFRKLLKIAYGRISALCHHLNVPMSSPLAPQVWVTFRHLLREHVELLYDRHVDHWILCALYGVSKTMKYRPEITFARLIEAYLAARGNELGDVTCQRIVRHIKIVDDSSDSDNMRDVITLYNKVFVPVFKDHLLYSNSIQRSTSLLSKWLSGDLEEEGGIHVKVQSAIKQAIQMQAALGDGEQKSAAIQMGKPESEAVARANEFAKGGEGDIEGKEEPPASDKATAGSGTDPMEVEEEFAEDQPAEAEETAEEKDAGEVATEENPTVAEETAEKKDAGDAASEEKSAEAGEAPEKKDAEEAVPMEKKTESCTAGL